MSDPINKTQVLAAEADAEDQRAEDVAMWLDSLKQITPDTEQLDAAFSQAQAEMPNAALNKINPHFNSKYADLASIREATLPSLTKYGLSIRQFTELEGERLVLITRLSHKSGQREDSRYPIALDRPQAMGSALTYARRYNWAGMCGVGFEEDDDATAAEREGPKPKAQSRELFTTLVDLMRDAKTQEELTLVIKENYEMYADLNDDWKRDIKKEGDRLRKLLPQ